ncbi:MAG: hypothetical protein FWG35_04425, partial [Spirochaetaceae bacterium]|nr:hypothetical protein [Spirochaetaceae bacterium]
MKGLVFLLCALSAFAFAEEKPALIIQPDPASEEAAQLIHEGQRFTLSFRVPAAAGDLRAQDTGFPDSVAVISGPLIFPVTDYDTETTGARAFAEVRYTLRALRSGRSVLGPLSYSVRGREFFTGELILETARQRDSRVPFGLAWMPLASEVYEGQTVAVFLEMQNVVEIAVPEAISVTPPAGALFEEAKGLGGITPRSAGGRELYSMTVSSWLLTPSSAGRVSLPPARVKAQGLTIDSPAASITVRSLPPEVKSTGAVGRFSVSSRTDAGEIFVGGTVGLFLRVEGEGNLNYLKPPSPDFEDALVTGPETTARLEPCERGYRGWIEWAWRLSPQKEGALTLGLPPFAWVDPETGEVSASREKSFRIQARAQAAAGLSPRRHEVLSSSGVEACESFDLYARPYLYVFLLPCGFFLARGFRAARRKGKTAIAGVLLAA